MTMHTPLSHRRSALPRGGGDDVEISVVIPVHDELGNLRPLVAALDAALGPTGRSHEYVLVDDGSTDGSGELLDELARDRSEIVPIHLRRCFGQTAAIDAGIRASRGDVLVFLDADLQNDPADIPALLARLDEGYDVVHGWRQARQDRFWSRRLPSLVANRLVRLATGVRVRDLGCALRVMRRDLAEELPLEGDMHRFIAVLAQARGARACEEPVRHHPRRSGSSKYGLSRTVKVLTDLVVLAWYTRFSGLLVRTALGTGLLCLAAACLLAAVALGRALVDDGTGWRSLATMAAACGIAGVQLVGLGLVAVTGVSAWWNARGLRPWSERPAERAGGDHARRREAA